MCGFVGIGEKDSADCCVSLCVWGGGALVEYVGVGDGSVDVVRGVDTWKGRKLVDEFHIWNRCKMDWR